MAIPKGLAAKARLKMDDGEKVYIEVRQGSPFCHFYTLYAARGRKRTPLISRSRNVAEDGIEQLVEALAMPTSVSPRNIASESLTQSSVGK